MPKQTLSQEELEVHELFSPSSNSTVSAQSSPSQRHPTATKSPQAKLPPKSQSKENSKMSNSEISSNKVKLFKEAYSSMHQLMEKIAKTGLLEALGDSDSDGELGDDNDINDDLIMLHLLRH